MGCRPILTITLSGIRAYIKRGHSQRCSHLDQGLTPIGATSVVLFVRFGTIAQLTVFTFVMIVTQTGSIDKVPKMIKLLKAIQRNKLNGSNRQLRFPEIDKDKGKGGEKVNEFSRV